ncbi:hypothetical protein [Algoriphagus sediminis]|uniref:Uncharacterized protein n=1 Tax=Algoriphagus sediminis TaxID=3057113 RepID=A0ABT7YFB2_9BACT|nr:hypothetical protein [Algoriphagus sediminis]MDN3205217.1 hypothetical protein [Algoriphagus sediminis]
MENDLIIQALKELHLAQQKSLKDVQNYLSMRYRIDLEESVLEIRLRKISQEEKAVA